MTTTILIADDHRLFRQGLVALLREHGGWEVVGEAGDGEEAIRLAEELKPQVAVLDVEMPRVNGVEAARAVRRASPATRIVALSMYADVHYQEQMCEAGAAAYVLKNEAIDDLVDAILTVLAGGRFVSPAASASASVPVSREPVDARELSVREREVLRLLAEGKRIKEIAHLLGISPKTVETYRARLTAKLGIEGLAGLVRFAIRAGLISPET